MAGKHLKNDEQRDDLSSGAVGTVSSVPERTSSKRWTARRIISNVLIFVGIALLLVAGGMWGYARYRYWMQDQINEKLAAHVTVSENAEGCPVNVDWAALKAINDDVVGWIYVPGTVVNYPVYQGETNEDYLRMNAEGEWTVGGQIFLDAESTAPGMVDNQSILYGHHLQDGTMFQPLYLLDDQEVFDKTDTIWYLTEANTYELEPLMLYWVEPYDQTVRQFRFPSVEAFRAYLNEKLGLAVTKREDAAELIASANRVLTMSTCNYYDGYGRSILVAIEKPKGSISGGMNAEQTQDAAKDATADAAKTAN